MAPTLVFATGVLTPLEKLRSKFIFQNEEMSHTCRSLRGWLTHLPFHTYADNRQLHPYYSEYSNDIKYPWCLFYFLLLCFYSFATKGKNMKLCGTFRLDFTSIAVPLPKSNRLSSIPAISEDSPGDLAIERDGKMKLSYDRMSGEAVKRWNPCHHLNTLLPVSGFAHGTKSACPSSNAECCDLRSKESKV